MTTKHNDRHVFYIDGRTQIEATKGSLDILGADNVEVQIDRDRRTLWVNASQWCKLRIHNIRGHYEYIDLSANSDRSDLYERAMANNERIRQGWDAPAIVDATRELDRVVRLHAAKRTPRK